MEKTLERADNGDHESTLDLAEDYTIAIFLNEKNRLKAEFFAMEMLAIAEIQGSNIATEHLNNIETEYLNKPLHNSESHKTEFYTKYIPLIRKHAANTVSAELKSKPKPKPISQVLEQYSSGKSIYDSFLEKEKLKYLVKQLKLKGSSGYYAELLKNDTRANT